MEIHSANGILTEEHFKSNRNVRFLTLLLLKNHRGFSTEEMVNALWETDAAPTSAKKIVSNVCSAIRETMRQHFPDMDLIVYENSEYRISSYYNVRTDYQEVQDLYAAANGESDKQKKADLLYQALTSHPGRLLTWNGFIVDGHNRYRILQAHPEIPYKTFEMEFPDRYAVLAWICHNQLGRRNLTEEQKKYLIGKQYNSEKASHGAADGFRGNQFTEVVSPPKGDLPKSNLSPSRFHGHKNAQKS